MHRNSTEECPSAFFVIKMSLYISPENVKLKWKDKSWAAEKSSLYTSFNALSSLKVSRRLHLSFSSGDQNKFQNARLQSV